MQAAAIRATVTKNIVEALKKDVRPWRRPWAVSANAGFPSSLSSGKRYRGINPLILELTADMKGYQSKWWGTYNQLQALGAQVRRGEKSTAIVLFKPIKVKSKDNPAETDTIPLMRGFNVFNLQQTDGGAEKFRDMTPPAETDHETAYATADRVIVATGAEIIHGGDSAHYSTATDKIHLPARGRFETVENYYATAFHELMHWSEKRISAERQRAKRSYSFMELYAEIGACFLTEETGVPMGERWVNHVDYIGGWIKELQNDDTAIFRAAALAEKGADHVLSYDRAARGVVESEEMETADA